MRNQALAGRVDVLPAGTYFHVFAKQMNVRIPDFAAADEARYPEHERYKPAGQGHGGFDVWQKK